MDRHNPQGATEIFGVDPATGAHASASATDDRVTMATLRAWPKWWCDPKRSKYGREEAGRNPKEKRDKVRHEIEARQRP